MGTVDTVGRWIFAIGLFVTVFFGVIFGLILLFTIMINLLGILLGSMAAGLCIMSLGYIMVKADTFNIKRKYKGEPEHDN